MKEVLLVKVHFDPSRLPIDAIAGEAAIDPASLSPARLRARFAEPRPSWEPEAPEASFVQPGLKLRRAAVLVPLVERPEGVTVLLTLRTDHLTSHAGQISFPGGRTEELDSSPIETALRAKAEQLWQHTVHVAALAGVLARRVTGVNPDTALFAGIIHEVGGFYLLSRADEFPGLLDDDPENWGELCEDVVGMEVLKKLAVPGPVAGAIGELRRAWINMPPSTLLDTLLLANQYAPVASPLGGRAEPWPDHADSALDFVIDDELLASMRAEAEEACRALGGPLLV
jgi:hypothetical protein